MSALTHISMQEQYAFLYEVLLEGLLCGCTGVPVERVASHISCLQGAETQSQNSVLEKEFKVPPGPGAAGLLPPATTLTQPWVRGGGECFSVLYLETEREPTGRACSGGSSLTGSAEVF